MDRGKVTVSNGIGRFHVYRAAQAAEQVDLLKYFITSFCVTAEWQSRVFEHKWTRTILGENQVKKASLRKYAGISSNSIRTLPLPELYLRSRGIVGHFDKDVSARVLRMFGKLSARFADDCQIFHVRSGFGNTALEQARKNGAICVVDHSAAAPSFLRRVDEELYEHWGNLSSEVSDFDLAKWSLVAQDVQSADYLVVNSDFVKQTFETYQNITSDRIFVVPMGVDTAIFRPRKRLRNESTPFTILYVGTISFRKGIHYLLEAFKRLRLRDARLVLVGTLGDAHQLLGEYEGSFEYVPHLPHPELVALYQSASVFVFPSLAEGSALVTYEAMASGLPVITTFEAGSVVRDGFDGLIVPARDVDALVEQISFIYEHGDVACEMGKNGQQNVVENYTWRHYAGNIVRIYQALLEARSKDITT